MPPRIDLTALQRTKWYEYLVRFVFGGCVTVLAGLVAREFGPVVGGLFLALPVIFPASATLIEKHETEKHGNESHRKEVGKMKAGFDAEGAALGSVGLAVFGWIVWEFLPEHPAGAVFASAFIAWFLVATALWGVSLALQSWRFADRSTHNQDRFHRLRSQNFGGDTVTARNRSMDRTVAPW